MKTHVLLVAKNFLKGHIHEGEPTFFPEKINSGSKVHTIRSNYDYWKKRIDEVNDGKAYLSIRFWESTPYHSNQFEFKKLTKCGIQKIVVKNNLMFINNVNIDKNLIALNDGLDRESFDSWFFKKPIEGPQEFALIHFTSQKY